jgi:predicted small secreted protein
MRKLLSLTIAAGYLLVIAGCNTMQGLGQDIERGGEKIQEKAKR